MEVMVQHTIRDVPVTIDTKCYHIWDNDDREIVLHRPDVVELVRKLQKVLRENK